VSIEGISRKEKDQGDAVPFALDIFVPRAVQMRNEQGFPTCELASFYFQLLGLRLAFPRAQNLEYQTNPGSRSLFLDELSSFSISWASFRILSRMGSPGASSPITRSQDH
jgi:hypothetical protein